MSLPDFLPALPDSCEPGIELSRVFNLLQDEVASSQACQACGLEGITKCFLVQITSVKMTTQVPCIC